MRPAPLAPEHSDDSYASCTCSSDVETPDNALDPSLYSEFEEARSENEPPQGLSERKRHALGTPNMRLKKRKLVERLEDIELESALDTCSNRKYLKLQEEKEKLADQLDEVEKQFDGLQEESETRLKRNTRRPNFNSVDGALKHLHGQERVFRHYFGFNSQFVKTLAPKVFHGPRLVERKGLHNVEMLLLVALAYLHTMGDWYDIQQLFGTDAHNLNSHFNDLRLDFVKRFAGLLDVKKSTLRFRNRGDLYREAFIGKHRSLTDGAEIPEMFSDIAAILDGLRQPVASSTDRGIQNVTWSGYTKSNNLVWGVLAAPDGMIVALTEPKTGLHKDIDFVDHTLLNCLEEYKLPALTDSIFSRAEDAIKPLPRKKAYKILVKDGVLEADARKKMSSLRVPIEWTLGHLETLFPRPFHDVKNQLSKVEVDLNLKMAVILYNFYTAAHGSQSSEYFEIFPPSLGDYMDIERWLN